MPRKSYTVKMYDNKPFTFDWDDDESGPLTQTVVKSLYEQEGPPLPEDIPARPNERLQFGEPEDEEEEPYISDTFQLPNFGNPETAPDVEEPSLWERANKSWLPNRESASTALPGLQTLSRMGDWAYSRIAQPAASPVGVATLPLAVNPIGRAALGVIGTGMGAYSLPGAAKEAYNNPSLESVADLGLSTVGAAALPLGWKAGAFGKYGKPGSPTPTPSPVSSLGLNLSEILADPPEPKRLYGGFDQQALLQAENPVDPYVIPTGEDRPTLGFTKQNPPLRAVEISAVDDGEQLTTRDFPTVGGMGRMPGPLRTRTVPNAEYKPGDLIDAEVIPPTREVTVDSTLPRVGGKGEYGVRGTPFFPTVPERMQTSTTQEMFRPVGEMLERMSEPPRPKTQHRFVDIEQPPTVETFPGWTAEEQAIRDRTFENLDEWGRVKQPPMPEVKEPTLGQIARARKRAGVEDWQNVDEYKPGDMIDVEVLNPNRPGGPKGPQGPIQDITPSKPLSGLNKAAQSPVPEIRKAAEQVAASRPKGTLKKSLYDPLATSGSAVLESMGDAGKQLSLLLKRTRAEGQIEAGTWSSKVREFWDPLDDAERSNVIDVVEGKTAPTSDKTRIAAEQVASILDESGAYGEKSGMRMSTPSGEDVPFKRMSKGYFPHMFEKGKFDEGSIFNKLVDSGMTPEEAKYVLESGIKKGERLISPQHMRSANLEGYRRDKGALYKHLDDLGKRAAEAKNLGAADLGDPNSPIVKLIKQTSDPERATKIIEQHLGRIAHDPTLNAAIDAVGTFEVATKLPTFSIGNMSQVVPVALRNNLTSIAKGLKQTLKGAKFAEESGALQSVLRTSFQEMGGENIVSKAYGMGKSERFLRSFAANSGKEEVTRSFNALKKNPKDKTARSRLQDLLLEDVDAVVKQAELTPEQVKMAGFRGSEITQGLTDPIDLPQWWSAHPLARIPALFKKFAFQQTKIIRDAIKENPKRNVPLALALYEVMGEGIGDTKTAIRAGIAGEDISEEIAKRGQGIDRLARNLSDGFAYGILTDMYDSIANGRPGDGRFQEWVLGPAISDVVNMGKATSQSIKKEDWTPLAKETVRKLPFGYAVARRFPDEKRKKKPKSLLPSMPKITGVRF